MSNHRSDLVNNLLARGFLYQSTDLDELDAAACADTPLVGYIGFDCTATSLHVGSLVQIMLLRRLQQAGHKPIVLMGGGTTKIGDPSDKDKSRPLLDDARITANMNSIKTVFEKFLHFGDGPTDAIMVNNADWLDNLQLIPFLRDVGRHFTINKMIKMESVKRRIADENEMTFLEFNYLLLQSYDFLELNQRHGCNLQLGGSDQWGNMVNGKDLIRRVNGNAAHVFTSPLIATASGGKMGKTADGAVWLNADMRSPYEYWQFWRNTEDADVGKFMRLFTDIPLDEIARLETLDGGEINTAKIKLANACTQMLHGAEAAKTAEATAKQTFEQGGIGADLPVIALTKAELQAGYPVLQAFTATGLIASNGEGKRHIKAGALKVNGKAVVSPQALLDEADFAGKVEVKLSIGKKKHAVARIK
ncbi:Tyrosyl-tRNA synthetase [hydrothermal vent metagenome]|uniref:tyrosine--tRNA ligase n=1 Tax=hydrothermal vent metagenome TaxID=652676 RepID=A0A3B0S9M9_9ZZZZ